MANMTGMHNQTKISVPGNQMFMTFESNSTKFVKKGFQAFIDKIGMLSLLKLLYLIQMCQNFISIYF